MEETQYLTVNPTGYQASFSPYKWEFVDPAPQRPIILPFGSDTAVAEKTYVLRILRAQANDGDIPITASSLPSVEIQPSL